MTKLLKKAFEEAAKLPDEDQDSPRPCWRNWRPSAAGTNCLRDQQTCSANSPRRPSRSIAPAAPSRWIRTGCDLAHYRAVSNCPWESSTRYQTPRPPCIPTLQAGRASPNAALQEGTPVGGNLVRAHCGRLSCSGSPSRRRNRVVLDWFARRLRPAPVTTAAQTLTRRSSPGPRPRPGPK